MKMVLIVVMMMLAMNVSAQTEDGGVALPDVKFDSLHLSEPTLLPQLSTPKQGAMLPYSSLEMPKSPRYVPAMDLSVPAYKTPGMFELWKGADLSITGGQAAMPGLMGINSGAIAFHQDYGRLHFAATGLANKYWMPGMTVGMPMLQTQFGLGGMVSYDVGKSLSLHAFGTYYAKNPLVGPALSPYVNTTQYGGYADIRLHKNFGVDTGVRRYLNPMTGQWVTDPIVRPYFKFNNGQKMGVDVGHLFKDLIWGRQNNFMPQGPVRMGPPTPRR